MTAPTEQPAPGGVPVTDETIQTYWRAYRSAVWPPEKAIRAGLVAVLADLAEAGRLLPEGGEAEEVRAGTAVRTIRSWPDGQVHYGPLRTVDT